MKEKILKWLLPALDRAGRTVAQTLISVIGVSKLISEVDWKVAISSALLAGVVSLLTSYAFGMPETKEEGE